MKYFAILNFLYQGINVELKGPKRSKYYDSESLHDLFKDPKPVMS